jgi:hypothetical protein
MKTKDRCARTSLPSSPPRKRVSPWPGWIPAFAGVKGGQRFGKLNERTGNLYENKGPLWKTQERNGNLAENKGTYGPYPGILLKTNDLAWFNGRHRGGHPAREASLRRSVPAVALDRAPQPGYKGDR